jgi:Amt family ammonium transporter
MPAAEELEMSIGMSRRCCAPCGYWRRTWLPALSVLAVLALVHPCAAATLQAAVAPKPVLDTGSTAWMMVSAALVMFMIPGLALFYAGMVRKKNVLATMMHSYTALAVVCLQWIVVGYMLAFGKDQHGFIGWQPADIFLIGMNPQHLVLQGGTYIPETVFCMFQAMFAMITPAVIAGSLAERMKFRSFVLFLLLWSTLVYDPLAHFVWGGGWLDQMHVADFAGGTVVEIASGVSGLVMAVFLGRRLGYPTQVLQPSSLALTLTGAGILWFGWYGFNAGSAGAANTVAGAAFLNTTIAAASSGVAWNFVEWLHHRRPSTLGLASGIVAGLVAITPACGFVALWSAPIIGVLAGVVCYLAVQFKAVMGYDDSLDAFGVHGAGGFLGMLLTGIFAVAAVNGVRGVIAGNGHQLIVQLTAAVATVAYVAVGTAVVGFVVDKTFGLRVSEIVETEGLDQGIHGESGWDIGAMPEMSIMAPSDAP